MYKNHWMRDVETLIRREKKELIEEFLRDWKWGRAYETHFGWLAYYDHCRCKKTTIQYWKWFEKKWEELRKNNG